jgi:cytochrome c-type biogenesis protein CcmH
MSWRRLLQNRSVLASAGVLLAVLIVWGVTLAAATRAPTLDDRVTTVASQLKCLPCQGESVADSPASWALQVRGVIRARLQQGASEQQVIQYFVARYGEDIRQDPPKSGFTLLMWLGPVAALVAGMVVVSMVVRQWRALEPLGRQGSADPELAGLSDAELEPYRALLQAEVDDLTPGPASTGRTSRAAHRPSAPLSAGEGGRGSATFKPALGRRSEKAEVR